MADRPKTYTAPSQVRLQHALYNLKLWLPSVFAAVLLLGLLTYSVVWPHLYFQDIVGRVQQQGLGTISSVSYGVTGQDDSVLPDTVLIAMDRGLGTYSYSNRLKHLIRAGQRVQVTYRIGKSGRVYVEDIEPTGATKP